MKRTKWNEPTSQEKQMERERKKQIGFRLEKKEKTINTESGSIAPKKDMHPKKKQRSSCTSVHERTKPAKVFES